MMKQRYYLLLLLLFLSACRCDPLRDKLTVVEGGKPRNAVMDFEQWETIDGMLEGQRLNNMLYAAARIDSGKWEIKAKIQLQEVDDREPAAFLEVGSNHLYIDLDQKTEGLWFVGPDLTDSLKFEGAQTATLFQADTLSLEVRGDDKQVSVWINGDSLSAISLEQKIEGKIGFYATRGILRIRDFKIVAHLSKLPHGDPPGRVFRRGEAGINTYRIPAVCAIGDSVVLAFCEGRHDSRSDDGDIDLRMRRSTDGGKSWGPMAILASEEKGSEIAFNNPAVIYSPETDLVHLLIGRDLQDIWYLQSADQGITWSSPRVLQDTSGGPLFPGLSRPTPAPGQATQIMTGDFAGRLVFPVWLIQDDEEGKRLRDSIYASVIYSDDTGRTWQSGGRIEGLPGPNEHQVVALPDGRLMSSVRLFRPEEKLRGVSLSEDGGASWSKVEYVQDLMDAGCEASLLADGGLLYFSNPANHEHYNRSRLVLRMSPDLGKSWGPELVLWESAAAYSDLVLLDGGKRLGCLFEFGYHYNYESIVLWTWDLDSLQKAGLPNP